MKYFPQLESGATVQYPLRKIRRQRCVVNSHLDGRRRKLLDALETQVEWELALTGLTSLERGNLETLFQEMEGRLGSFTFLDPVDNLVLWSEDLSNAAWVKGPLIELTSPIADPAGTNRATRIANTGAAAQTVEQVVAGPGGHHYCFSLYARSAQEGSVTLFRAAGPASDSRSYRVGAGWTRLTHSGRFETSADGVRFGISLPAGTTVDVYGMQVESQPAPSPYRRTTSRCGVYPEARFADDILTVTAHGPESYGCLVRIVARVS